MILVPYAQLQNHLRSWRDHWGKDHLTSALEGDSLLQGCRYTRYYDKQKAQEQPCLRDSTAWAFKPRKQMGMEILCQWKICGHLNSACGCVVGYCPKSERKAKGSGKDRTAHCLPPRLAAGCCLSPALSVQSAQIRPLSPPSQPCNETCACLPVLAEVGFVPVLAYSVVWLLLLEPAPNGSCGLVGWFYVLD